MAKIFYFINTRLLYTWPAKCCRGSVSSLSQLVRRWDQTRAFVVTDWQPTGWSITRPFYYFLFAHLTTFSTAQIVKLYNRILRSFVNNDLVITWKWSRPAFRYSAEVFLEMLRKIFNLLKPTVYLMHQQFNIQQLNALSTLYLCVLYLSENKQRLVPLTA